MENLTVLIAGGAGYIGTHMVKDLLGKGFRVVILDNLSTGHADLLPGGHFIKGNLDDPALLDDLFSRYSIDGVMHFAAFSLVGESVGNPLKYYTNNVAATTNLLTAMIKHDVKYFIFSSSAAVYGEPDEIPIKEHQSCKPTNPYGISKITVERILKDCDKAYGLKYVAFDILMPPERINPEQ